MLLLIITQQIHKIYEKYQDKKTITTGLQPFIIPLIIKSLTEQKYGRTILYTKLILIQPPPQATPGTGKNNFARPPQASSDPPSSAKPSEMPEEEAKYPQSYYNHAKKA